jgi:hypothetical protein
VQAKAIADMAIANLHRAQIAQDQVALLLFTMLNEESMYARVPKFEDGRGNVKIAEEN